MILDGTLDEVNIVSSGESTTVLTFDGYSITLHAFETIQANGQSMSIAPATPEPPLQLPEELPEAGANWTPFLLLGGLFVGALWLGSQYSGFSDDGF